MSLKPRASNGPVRLMVCLCSALTVGACGGRATGPSSAASPPLHLSGSYTLQSVGGSPLPFPFDTTIDSVAYAPPDTCVRSLVSGTLAFSHPAGADQDSVALRLVYHGECSSGISTDGAEPNRGLVSSFRSLPATLTADWQSQNSAHAVSLKVPQSEDPVVADMVWNIGPSGREDATTFAR